MNFQNSEWNDLIPIPQDDGPNPLVSIAYAKEYNDSMSYFRAILQKNEKSSRVLQLTADILEWNPGHYTVWTYRMETILALIQQHPDRKQDYLASELDFVETMAHSTPKSYQLWHYRQRIVSERGSLGDEISFVNTMLDNDSKNYHAWAYRQWLVSTFNLWDSELNQILEFFEKDVRNNSAWNQRFFVLTRRPDAVLDVALWESEVGLVETYIKLAPNNESPWNYLKGILDFVEPGSKPSQMIQELCLSYTTGKSPVTFALSLIAELYKEQKAHEEYIQTCERLQVLDPIRQKYWAFKKTLIGR